MRKARKIDADDRAPDREEEPGGDEFVLPGWDSAPEIESAIAAIQRFMQGFDVLVADLKPHLRTVRAASLQRLGRVHQRRLHVMPAIANLAKEFSELEKVGNPDVIQSQMVLAMAFDITQRKISGTATAVDIAARIASQTGWKEAGMIYSMAQRLAKTKSSLRALLQPIRAALKRGSRVETAAVRVAVVGHKATKARTRADAATRRAEAVERSAQRHLEAAADQGDDLAALLLARKLAGGK